MTYYSDPTLLTNLFVNVLPFINLLQYCATYIGKSLLSISGIKRVYWGKEMKETMPNSVDYEQVNY